MVGKRMEKDVDGGACGRYRNMSHRERAVVKDFLPFPFSRSLGLVLPLSLGRKSTTEPICWPECVPARSN
jgi:hypothetical protein